MVDVLRIISEKLSGFFSVLAWFGTCICAVMVSPAVTPNHIFAAIIKVFDLLVSIIYWMLFLCIPCDDVYVYRLYFDCCKKGHEEILGLLIIHRLFSLIFVPRSNSSTTFFSLMFPTLTFKCPIKAAHLACKFCLFPVELDYKPDLLFSAPVIGV